MAGFNILDIMNESKGNAEEGFEAIQLDYKDIIVTKHNKYSMEELQEMATGIHMAGGLQQPLVLGRVNGEYWLVSGHRRMAGIEILVTEGEEEFRTVDCRYKDMTETEFRMQLLIGNTFNRKMTDYDRMIQAQEWKEVIDAAKADGTFKPEKGTRTRDYIAMIMGTSAAVVGDLNRINANATDDVKEQFKEGNINQSAAAAASQLPEDMQNEIAEAAAAGKDIKSTEIQAMVEEQKEQEENKITAQQHEANVSDTDTTDEEKENARKLHALKMLERYYTFMNDEEVGILERMLEDCKRRKREYGIEDCGSTI